MKSNNLSEHANLVFENCRNVAVFMQDVHSTIRTCKTALLHASDDMDPEIIIDAINTLMLLDNHIKVSDPSEKMQNDAMSLVREFDRLEAIHA